MAGKMAGMMMDAAIGTKRYEYRYVHTGESCGARWDADRCDACGSQVNGIFLAGERCQVVIPDEPEESTEGAAETEPDTQHDPKVRQDPADRPDADNGKDNQPGSKVKAALAILVAAMTTVALFGLAGCGSKSSSSSASSGGTTASTGTAASTNKTNTDADNTGTNNTDATNAGATNTNTSQTDNASSASSFDATELALEIEKFGDTCPIELSFTVEPSQINDVVQMFMEPIVTEDAMAEITDVRAIIVFYDLYGDYVGDYKWEYATRSDSEVSVDCGGEKIGSVKIYIYSVLLGDGTRWGDKDASTDYMITLGTEIDSDVKQY